MEFFVCYKLIGLITLTKFWVVLPNMLGLPHRIVKSPRARPHILPNSIINSWWWTKYMFVIHSLVFYQTIEKFFFTNKKKMIKNNQWFTVFTSQHFRFFFKFFSVAPRDMTLIIFIKREEQIKWKYFLCKIGKNWNKIILKKKKKQK